ncbi:MAG: hypothetical protein MI975_25190 [Cytophagales bacterium]|nr:hypothetical protein [Cytophagales bacterium]
MQFRWNKKFIDEASESIYFFKSYEELLDIIEDYWEEKVLSFEIVKKETHDASVDNFTHVLLIKFKDHKKLTGVGEPIAVGHINKENINLRIEKNSDN